MADERRRYGALEQSVALFDRVHEQALRSLRGLSARVEAEAPSPARTEALSRLAAEAVKLEDALRERQALEPRLARLRQNRERTDDVVGEGEPDE